VLPEAWRHYEHHPALETAPKTTRTAEGLPGDPLNVALVGSEAELIQALLRAGWSPADPLTFRSSLRIAEDVVRNHPYPDAPVSNLYLWGRKQDVAFERPVGNSPKRRHHVRFWRNDELGFGGRHFWIGAATFDSGIGLSHRTGQITHHIEPDIDTERDTLIADVSRARQVIQLYQVTGVGATLNGRNGNGDRYYTDGELTTGVLAGPDARPTPAPERLPNPVAVDFKNVAWDWLRPWLQ
jgi:hypothetical protein